MENHICSSLREGGGTLGKLFTALAMLVAALRIIPERMFASVSIRFPPSVGAFQLCVRAMALVPEEGAQSEHLRVP